MDSLTAFEEEEQAFVETAWGPDNQERLEHQMKQLADDLMYVPFHPSVGRSIHRL